MWGNKKSHTPQAVDLGLKNVAIREEIRYEFPPVSFCSGSFLGGRGCAEADEEAAHKGTAVY
jgi:hypothetical protein